MGLPSGKRTKNYGKSPFSMGKSTISMAMFNSYVCLPEGYFSKAGDSWECHQDWMVEHPIFGVSPESIADFHPK